MAETRRDITLLVTNYPFDPSDVERLRVSLGDEALLTTRGSRGLAEALAAHPEADVICTFDPPENLLDVAPGLRWLALSSAGADHILRTEWIRSPELPLITTANGVHAIPISEHVFSAILLWARHWPAMLAAQAERRWPSGSATHAFAGRELADTSLLVVGLGAIGRRVAQLGRAFGMRTLATRRSVAAGASDPDVDVIAPHDQLDELLPQADYVVLCIPSTPENFHLINADRLHRMKASALLVNIARGSLIDEPALIAALQAGALGGAALDVAEQEPLPPEHPLWTAPNIIISPHLSGRSPRYGERLADLLLDNIARYREGRPLRNQVDVARGY